MRVKIVNIFKYIKAKITSENPRTALIKKNIIGSAFLRIINIIISLAIVPLTINYLSSEGYGIWLTMSSIVGWLSYFDLGLAQGFRNKFAEARANNNDILARQYVSTTYISLSVIFSIILVIIIISNNYLDWCKILKINEQYYSELKYTFIVLSFSFCTNMVANTYTMMLNADQRSALASSIQTFGQFIALIGVLILRKNPHGSLVDLAIAYSVLPCISLIILSIFSFNCSKYKKFRPSLKFYDKRLIKEIITLGINFFIIMASMLIIFQCINIIISRILGPNSVTEYNIAFKYFNVLKMISVIILTPCWSAFTEAYVKKDYKWMAAMVKKLERLCLSTFPILVFMCLLSPYIFKIWIGNTLFISNTTVILVAIYIFSQMYSGIYMYLINGIGKVKLQMLVYIIFSIISIPLMILLGHRFGLVGILSIPIITFITQTIIAKHQLSLLINNNANGIWNK